MEDDLGLGRRIECFKILSRYLPIRYWFLVSRLPLGEDCLRMLGVPVCGFYGVNWGFIEGLLLGVMRIEEGWRWML